MVQVLEHIALSLYVRIKKLYAYFMKSDKKKKRQKEEGGSSV